MWDLLENASLGKPPNESVCACDKSVRTPTKEQLSVSGRNEPSSSFEGKEEKKEDAGSWEEGSCHNTSFFCDASFNLGPKKKASLNST